MPNRKTKTKSKQRQTSKQKPKKKQASKPKPKKQSGYSSVGALIGHHVQKFGESVFNRIMGMGDYKLQDNVGTIRKNSLFVGGANQPPSFSGGKSSFVFEHSEYIQDIVGGVSGAFKQDSFTLNPINAKMFPWLSALAASFETYEVEGMIFRFESDSGMAISGTNSALGTVMGYFNYDTLNPPYASKQQLLQYEGCVDAKTSESFLVGVECDPKQLVNSKLYVGNVPTGADAKTYNMGNLIIASAGLQANNQVIGELWVHYRIRFHVTKPNSGVASNNTFITTILTGNPFGVLLSQSGIVTSSIAANGQSITYSNCTVGTKYILCYNIQAATSITGISTSFAPTGATAVAEFGPSGSTYSTTGAASTPAMTINYCFIATSSTVTLSDTSLGSTIVGACAGNLLLTPCDVVTL
jgi:hypothetical protein